MQGVSSDSVTTKDFFDTWKVGYSHYHNRQGSNLPTTKKLLEEMVRVDSRSDWNIYHESLTHDFDELS